MQSENQRMIALLHYCRNRKNYPDEKNNTADTFNLRFKKTNPLQAEFYSKVGIKTLSSVFKIINKWLPVSRVVISESVFGFEDNIQFRGNRNASS